MLSCQSRKGGKENFHRLVIIALVALGFFSSCEERRENPNRHITLESLSGWRKTFLHVDASHIGRLVYQYHQKESLNRLSDKYTHGLYKEDDRLFWSDFRGISCQADSLVAVLSQADSHGLSARIYRLEEIEADIRRMRSLDFDESDNTMEKVVVRLDYRLTLAYLRYASGMRFGFVNPIQTFNRLDPLKYDTLRNRVISYRGLFDIGVERPDRQFYVEALSMVARDGVAEFLHEAEPDNSLYALLKRHLAVTDRMDKEEQKRIVCNLERCRWRGAVPPIDTAGCLVVVNLPAFHLYAYGADSLLDMKVGCGTVKNKTPLLVSAIKRMEVNPLWNIPYNILRDEVAHHAGDSAYFVRNRYFIIDKNTGRQLLPSQVSASMLRSGDYRVSQEGGEGNSLGRIVFRFDNNFSVFLHDTSSRSFFQRDNRGVSHGCVRVEKPFDLALFLWRQDDEWERDKLRISMGMEPLTEKGKKYVEKEMERRGMKHDVKQMQAPMRLINVQRIEPPVKLYITYFTLYPADGDRLENYPDIYGYDDVIQQEIKPFIRHDI